MAEIRPNADRAPSNDSTCNHPHTAAREIALQKNRRKQTDEKCQIDYFDSDSCSHGETLANYVTATDEGGAAGKNLSGDGAPRLVVSPYSTALRSTRMQSRSSG